MWQTIIGLLRPAAQISSQQVRNRHWDALMRRDLKRRAMMKEYYPERQRINSIRKNTILPKELQEIADKEIHAMPRDSCPSRLHSRCVVTSRPRGLQDKWRVSRIVWRQLVDYNQMSGLKRACW
ncbi:hypothetical protein SNE40_006308 [Patella caerulea]|uniref:28S ribosomal protein S14, mitochondrial n=1 Tax=Patella caerulea TaxID=87958 RepID=A0AAN8K153_PATCE